MAFDLEGARREGYSDAEIAAYLASRSRFNLDDAKREGYTDEQIIGFLSKGGARAPQKRPSGTQGLPGSMMQAEIDAVQPPEPVEDKPSATWGEVAESLPAQFVAGTRSATAQLRRMAAEESIAGREEGLRPTGDDPSGWGALVEPSAVERQAKRLEADREALTKAEADAAEAASDMRLVTPEHQSIAQEALSSLAQSSGPTLIGLATGILTRNVPLAMAIAGGGGAAQQAGATYGEARERGADHRQASVAATIDATLEAGGEMLPLAYALKPGTPAFKRIFGTLAREAGQEAATQFAQDLRAMAMEHPDLTWGEVWRNVRVAALAGAGGGAVYGGAGAAVNWSREREAAKQAEATVDILGSGSVDQAIDAALEAERADAEQAAIAAAIASARAELEREAENGVAIDATVEESPAEAALRSGAQAENPAALDAPTSAQAQPEAGTAQATTDEQGTQPEQPEQALPPETAAAEVDPTDTATSNPPRWRIAPQPPVRIFGKPLAALTDRELEVASKAHSMPASRAAALAEVERRAAGIAQAPNAQAAPEAQPPAAAALQEPAGGAAAAPPPMSDVDRGAHEAAVSPLNEKPEPSKEQIVAGNAELGHARINGMDISVENPAGSVREDKNNTPPKWRTEMKSHYGYVRGTVGYDKDHVDVFVRPGTPEDWAGTVYVVNQNKANGNFDEHKAMLGFSDYQEARTAYLSNYEAGWEKNVRSIVPMPLEAFKAWARDKGATGPKRGPAKPQPARPKKLPAVDQLRIFGRRPEELSDRQLEVAMRSRRVETHEAARMERTRRGAAGEQPTTELPAQVADLTGGEQGEKGVPASESTPGTAEIAPPPTLEATGIVMTPPYSEADAKPAEKPGDARPDAIRQAIRDLFRVPLNEGRFNKSRDVLGIYKTKVQAIRVRNQNDIGVITHELGHHISETSPAVREARKAFDNELRTITPYAARQKSTALQREEGMAEFVRFYLTHPAQAKAKAPGFFKAFDEYIEARGLKGAIEGIAGRIREWQNLPPADRILAKVGESEPPFRKRFNVDRLVFEVFDRWLPLKRMVQDLKPGVAPSADPFKLAHLLSGDAAIIEDWLLRETVPFSHARRADPKDRGKPLAEILKPIEAEQREFGAYLIANRANELMRRDKEHLYSRDEIAAALKLETRQFREAATEIYAYQDQLLDYAVEGGLLSAGAASAFRQFPFYVPFFRVGEPLGRRAASIFKEIRGGTENLRDPIANIIENTVRVIHATNRNYVLAKAHDLARSVPGGARWIEDVPVPERAVKIETQKIIEALREQGVDVSTDAAEVLATTQTFFVKNPFGDDRDRVIVIRRSGRPYALQVNDEMLWHALERFEPVDMGLIEKLLAVPADILRAGIVLSPEFMARNFARDTLSGFIQSKAGILPVAGTVSGFKEIVTRSDAARLYRAFGGAYGDMWRADTGFERKLVERMARHGGFDPRTIVTPRGLLSLLHRLGSVTEAGTRVAEFKKSASMGTQESEPRGTAELPDIDSLIDAAYNAREVSVDFGMHGHSRSVRFLTRITPFLNPALQGWYKAVRTGKTRPFTTLLRGGVLTAASIFLYLSNRDEEWYDEIEQWERNVYWHVDIGLRDPQGQVIPLRIPKPFELGGLFGSIPEALTQVAIDRHGKRFAKRLESIFDDVFAIRVVPTALLVPAELWANKNQFTGRPIVPEHRERLAPELQYTPASSAAARALGELTDTSPAKLDHAVRGFFGTLGTYSLMLTDQAMRLSKDEPALPLPWQRAPVARVFFRDSSGANSRHVTEFYELLRDARRAEASLKYMEPERMAEYYERHKGAIEQRRGAEKVSRFLARLRRENEEIRQDRDMPGQERMSMIVENNRQIRWLARDFVRATESAR